MSEWQVIEGDCVDTMRALPEASIDAIVCDPPYGISFMLKEFDTLGDGPAQQAWHLRWCEEAYRVLKPGGHLLAFGGTRTYHRLACAVEDAGFEIRDSIASLHWVQAQGFPKSLDISKAIDASDKTGKRHEQARRFTAWMRSTGITARQINKITNTDMGYHLTTHPTQPEVATEAMFSLLRPHLPPVPDEIDKLVRSRTIESENLKRRKIISHSTNGISGGRRQHTGQADAYGFGKEYDITAPATDAARQWSGWGSALKPSHEPIVVARKPLIGTLATNVLKHGTGGMNIDGCRVEMGEEYDPTRIQRQQIAEGTVKFATAGLIGKEIPTYKPGGRWPPNLVFTHLPGCRRVGDRKVKGNGHYPATRGASGYDGGLHGQTDLDEKHTCTETISAWACEPGCPVAEMDRQSGVTTSSGPGTRCNRRDENGKCQGHENATLRPTFHADERAEENPDTGGLSRMFPQFEYDHADPFTAGFKYVAKPSTAEREAGCDGLTPGRWEEDRDPDSVGANNPRSRSRKERSNLHPTVKPIGIMRWLIRLVTPPGGTVLDPFCGSGTTGCAAMLEGFDFIGCEREPEYIAIARARIAHWQAEAERHAEAAPDVPRKARQRRPRAEVAPTPDATPLPSVEAPPLPPVEVSPQPSVEATPAPPRRRRRVEAPDDSLLLPFPFAPPRVTG